MTQILFFGSSSVHGVGDPQGGWVDRFKRQRHNEMYGEKKNSNDEIFNLGVPGDTSAQLLNRISYELPARQRESQPMVVVISAGGNDSRAADSPTNFISSPDEFMANLENIVEIVRSYTPFILFVGLTPVDDTRTRPMPDGSYFSQARIQKFDEAMGDVADSHHLPRVELYASMLALDWRAMLYEDGLHLNEVGHNWLFERIRQPLANAVYTAEHGRPKETLGSRDFLA
ncbi:MAG TPA: GDSL-type esterase/lipase family protein [Candidatus Saccharimonadales bacterium]|nr:GDSL-type esterase/lipase family protein [Candidatus Saccharimonadales bacterium]